MFMYTCTLPYITSSSSYTFAVGESSRTYLVPLFDAQRTKFLGTPSSTFNIIRNLVLVVTAAAAHVSPNRILY